MKLTAETYDLITAFNTAFLWKTPGSGIVQLVSSLKKTGIFCLFYQAPYPVTLAEAIPIKGVLNRQGLSVESVHLEKITNTTALALIASRNN